MSKKHEKVLRAIFSDHPSGNMHWNEIESLLSHLNAEMREAGGARVMVVLNGHEITLHRPHHGSTFSKPSLHQLRQFLDDAGATP